MPICHERKIVFIHIPKNAGTAIEKSLGVYGDWRRPCRRKLFGKDTVEGVSVALQHLTIQQATLWDMLGEGEGWVKFAVIRNPWSRCWSSFAWHKKNGLEFDFSEFLDLVVERQGSACRFFPIANEVHFQPQVDFILDRHMNVAVDFLLSFENLASDFKSMCRRIGTRVPKLKKANMTSGGGAAMMTPKEIIRVGEIFAADVEFGCFTPSGLGPGKKLAKSPNA